MKFKVLFRRPGLNSYSSIGGNLKSLINETINLYRSRKGDEQMNAIVSGLREMESLFRSHYAFEIRDRDILDIGSGQLLIQPRYFATQNRVTGIDLDVIAQGIRPGQYVRMLRLNGGELEWYDLEELLINHIKVIWRK
jgi:hypothetical protein